MKKKTDIGPDDTEKDLQKCEYVLTGRKTPAIITISVIVIIKKYNQIIKIQNAIDYSDLYGYN